MTAYDDDAERLGEECEYCGLPNANCRCDELCPVCGRPITQQEVNGPECSCGIDGP